MDFKFYLVCFLSGTLGILFHLFAVKIPSVKARATAANMKFDLVQYLKTDITAIISSFIGILLVLVIIDELTNIHPKLMLIVKILFAFVGFSGSSILIHALGRFDGLVRRVVDVKTNIADGIIPGPPPDIKQEPNY